MKCIVVWRVYAELFMGVYDVDGCFVGRFSRYDEPGNPRCFERCRRGSEALYNNVGNHVAVDWYFGNRTKGRIGGTACKKDVADPALFISKYSRGPSGQIVDCDEYDR